MYVRMCVRMHVCTHVGVHMYIRMYVCCMHADKAGRQAVTRSPLQSVGEPTK